VPLAGVDEPTQVANVPRCDDHLEGVLGDKQRLRREDHVAVQRRVVGRRIALIPGLRPQLGGAAPNRRRNRKKTGLGFAVSGFVFGLRGVRLCFWFRKQLIRTKNKV